MCSFLMEVMANIMFSFLCKRNQNNLNFKKCLSESTAQTRLASSVTPFDVSDFVAAQQLLLPKLPALNNIIWGLKRFKRCELKSVLI